jgi:hypothetical protein
MKQGILLILLIATVGIVGYTLYQSNQERVTQLWSGSGSQEVSQPTPSATPTMVASTQPTVVVMVPTTQVGPKQLPNTGVFDAGNTWSDTPAIALLIGLLITSTTLFWFGRRD